MQAKHTINLLPWRLNAHKQRRRALLFTVLLLSFISISCWVSFHYFIQKLNQNYQQQSLELQQIEQQLHAVKNEIGQIQHSQITSDDQAFSMNKTQLRKVLTLLTQLPFTQGELHTLDLNPLSTTQLNMTLQGIANNSHEFEQLHTFLNQYSGIEHIQLVHFEPQQNQQLYFQFQLTLQEETP